MRKSVAFFCIGCLLLCAVVLEHGRQEPTGQPRANETSTALAAEPPLSGITKKTPLLLSVVQNVPSESDLIQQIISGLNSGNPGDPAIIFTNQLLALIASNPWAAAHLAESSEVGDWRSELMRVVAQKWAASNPVEAAGWVAQLPDANERDTILGCVCFQVAQSDPFQAIQILEQQGLNDRRDIMLGNLAQQWASKDLAAASVWAASYPSGSRRDELFMHIALAENEVDPKAAAQIVADQIEPGEVQNQAAFSVLDRWAWGDPTGALSWVTQFPEGEFKVRALTQLNRIAAIQNSDK